MRFRWPKKKTAPMQWSERRAAERENNRRISRFVTSSKQTALQRERRNASPSAVIIIIKRKRLHKRLHFLAKGSKKKKFQMERAYKNL